MDSGNVAQIASALLSLITLAYVMLSARSKASTEAHTGLERRVTSIETTVAGIRSDLMHMPDKEATHRLELRLAEIVGAMDVIKAELKPIAATNSRIQDWMEERAK